MGERHGFDVQPAALLSLHHGDAAMGRLESARTVGADSRQISAAEPAADTDARVRASKLRLQ